jgi:hypothetical protein
VCRCVLPQQVDRRVCADHEQQLLELFTAPICSPRPLGLVAADSGWHRHCRQELRGGGSKGHGRSSGGPRPRTLVVHCRLSHDPEALWFTACAAAWKSVRSRGLYWCVYANS